MVLAKFHTLTALSSKDFKKSEYANETKQNLTGSLHCTCLKAALVLKIELLGST